MADIVVVNGDDAFWNSKRVQNEISAMQLIAPNLQARYVAQTWHDVCENGRSGSQTCYDIDIVSGEMMFGVQIDAADWNVENIVAILKQLFDDYLQAKQYTTV